MTGHSYPSGGNARARSGSPLAKWWFECTSCGATQSSTARTEACPCGHGTLNVRYSPNGAATLHCGGIFRFGDRLPIDDPATAVTLGEGDTPLIAVATDWTGQQGLERIQVKCEFMNPTGSFKDRIAAVAATIMRERGIRACIGTSSGNGGAAMAAYAARAGRELLIFALSDTLSHKVLQIRATGGRLVYLDGLGHDAATTDEAVDMILAACRRHSLFAFVTAHRFMPDAMEGAKTIAFELAEQAPDATVAYVPIGGGGLYSAIWHGYQEIADTLPGGPPRLVAVQPAGCATINRLLRGEPPSMHTPVRTTISGLQVASLFDADGTAAALAQSGGHLVEIDDAAAWRAQAILAHEGLLVEPAGATAFAGLLADIEQGLVSRDDRAVVIATGAGHKDPASLERVVGAVEVERAPADEIDSLVATAFGRP